MTGVIILKITSYLFRIFSKLLTKGNTLINESFERFREEQFESLTKLFVGKKIKNCGMRSLI